MDQASGYWNGWNSNPVKRCTICVYHVVDPGLKQHQRLVQCTQGDRLTLPLDSSSL